MGVVYLARQLSLGRLVALKMLPGDLSGDQAALARFRREIRALGRCDHPNIVKVLASGELPDGRLYYAMEYVPGCDLEQVWREMSGSAAKGDASHLGGSSWAQAVLSASRKRREAAAARPAAPTVPLPPLPELPGGPDDPGGYVRRVAGLMRDTALALQTVHDQRLVHRDVKPANLMLTPDGLRVVLMDFGLAKGESLTTPESRAGGLLGTLRYAAPEQLASANLAVGPAADVRGLGVTLWEMLTRRRLFAEVGEDEARLAQRVLTEDPPLLRRVDPSLGRDLEAIVARATERRVADRIPTARRLAEYLQLYLDGRPLPIRPPGLRERAWRWARVHKTLGALAAAAAGVLLLLVVLAGMMLARSSEQRQGVNADLAEAATLRDAAKFPEARLVVERAKERLGRGGPADLQEQVRQVSADLDMLDKLETIPLLMARLKRNQFDWEAADRAYQEAFADYGVDVTAGPAAAGRIKASAIREQLVAALDDSARTNNAPDGTLRQRLLDSAQLADSNAETQRLRGMIASKDVKALRDWAARPESADATPTASLLLAGGLRQLGDEAKAVDVLTEAQRRRPDHFRTTLYLSIYSYNIRPDEAIGALQAALASHPESVVLHDLFANVLDGQSRPAEAEAEYHKALALQPDDAQVHYDFGVCLYSQGKRAEAEAEFRKALSLQPDYAEAHTHLGNVLDSQAKPADAEAEYHKALELQPKDAQAHYDFGLCLNGQGKWAEAEAQFRKAVELKPDFASAHKFLGNVLLGQNKPAEAEAEYRKAVEVLPDFAAAHNNIGVCLKQRGKKAEAEAEFRKAAELDPALIQAHTNLGDLLDDQGKYAEAEAEYRKAADLAPRIRRPGTALASAWNPRESTPGRRRRTRRPSNSSPTTPAPTTASVGPYTTRASRTRRSPSTARPWKSTPKTPTPTTTSASHWPTKASRTRRSPSTAKPWQSTLSTPGRTTTWAAAWRTKASRTRRRPNIARLSKSSPTMLMPTTILASCCSTGGGVPRPRRNFARPSISSPTWRTPTTI